MRRTSFIAGLGSAFPTVSMAQRTDETDAFRRAARLQLLNTFGLSPDFPECRHLSSPIPDRASRIRCRRPSGNH